MSQAPSRGAGSVATDDAEIRHYFEAAPFGIELVDEGLREVSFGEFLVEHRVLDRYQLFRALQLQDHHPKLRLGECAVMLGFASMASVESAYQRFSGLGTLTVD